MFGYHIDILSDSYTIIAMDFDNTKVKRVAAPVRCQVEQMIRESIVDGRLKPGERLVESKLAASLKVSRPIVREALRQLEAEQIVTIVPQHGARVATLELKEISQIYEVRAQLEALVGRKFALEASDEAIRELKRVLNKFQEAVNCELNGKNVLEIKEDFYSVLLSNCGNKVACEMLTRLNNRVSLLRAISLSQPGRSKESLVEVARIVQAIENRDPDAAYHACVRHVENASACIYKAVQSSQEA